MPGLSAMPRRDGASFDRPGAGQVHELSTSRIRVGVSLAGSAALHHGPVTLNSSL